MEKNLQEILAALRKSVPMSKAELAKATGTFLEATTATSGITAYDLEAGAKLLYPVPTPLRNMTPRVSGKGGIQANWRAITGVNVSGMRVGVSESNRGGLQAVSTQDYTAAYKGIGIESSASFESYYAGQGFDDVRALAAKTGLESLMLGEEAMILGGNTSLALSTTPTPSLTAGTGGSLAAATVSVIAVALSLDGMLNASLANGIQASITRSNTDGSSDTFGGGAAQKSTNATVAVSASGSISAIVAPVRGALGYAWFWGAAGSEVLGAITSINSIVISANATGTQTAASLPSSDNSTNSLSFDGLLTQAFKSGSNAYYAVQANGTAGTGTPLTADGAGGVVEIDAALKSFFDNYRLSPDTIWSSSQEANNISKKILAGNANAAQRIIFAEERDNLGGGIMVRTYLNKFSMAGGSTLDIRIHPNMPPGTLLFTSKSIPYPLSGVGNVFQIRTRQEYYQIEWPLRSRKYEYGVYADEVLQHYFPPSMGIITNIGNG